MTRNCEVRADGKAMHNRCRCVLTWSKMRWITQADAPQKVSCAAESATPPAARTVMFFTVPSAFFT